MDEQFATKTQLNQLGEVVVRMRNQLVVSQIAIRALLLSHPDTDDAIATVCRELERWQANALNSTLPDFALEDFEKAKGLILPSDADLLRARS